jgi:ornithine cyclodeaminase/alanine dehydrogenase
VTLFLSEDDVERLLSVEDARREVRRVFELLAGDGTANYPRQRGGFDDALLNVMWAVSRDLRVMGAKVYPVVRTDVSQSSTSTFLLYSIPDGRLEAVLEAELLGQRRTAAASAVATQALAREDSETLTVIGTGWQAAGQVPAVAAVMPNLRRVVVVGRTTEAGLRFAQAMQPSLSVSAEVATTPEEAVYAADVLVTATGSYTPVVDGSWLRDGVHINAVGANYATKRELDRETIARADVIVVDSREVATQECGDLLLNAGAVDSTVELAAVLMGLAQGRTDAGQITLFESHGLAVQDLACARHILERATEEGMGARLPARTLHAEPA